MAELLKHKKSFLLHVNDFLFYKNDSQIGTKGYCKCQNYSVRATTDGDEENLVVVQVVNNIEHYAPN